MLGRRSSNSSLPHDQKRSWKSSGQSQTPISCRMPVATIPQRTRRREPAWSGYDRRLLPEQILQIVIAFSFNPRISPLFFFSFKLPFHNTVIRALLVSLPHAMVQLPPWCETVRGYPARGPAAPRPDRSDRLNLASSFQAWCFLLSASGPPPPCAAVSPPAVGVELL